MKKFTFKKRAKSGRFSFLEPDYTEVKYKKRIFGNITQDNEKNFYIARFAVEISDGICSWQWRTFKERFPDEKSAREYFNSRDTVEYLLKVPLHFFEV